MPVASETSSSSRHLSSPQGRRRAFVVVAGALALGALAALAWWLFVRGDAAPTFRLAKAERGALTAVVSASGTLSAVTTVAVGSQISGQIKELFVDFNSPVKKGQLLARIDPETYDLKVKQAQADLDAAASALTNQKGNVLVLQSQALRARIQANDAKADLERKKSLFAKGFISDAERDKAQFNYDALAEAVQTAEAQVAVGESQVANAAAVIKQREAALASARVDLARTSIIAPVDGVVISRQVDAGQTVAASLNTPTLFTIAKDLRDMQVEVAIDESDISKIRLDQRVTFTVDAFAGRTFEGKVAQIRKAAQSVQNVVTYTVVVATSNPNLLLVPGMTANARIVSDARENVLKVPNAALRYRPPGVAAAKDAETPSAAPGTGSAAAVGAAAMRRRAGRSSSTNSSSTPRSRPGSTRCSPKCARRWRSWAKSARRTAGCGPNGCAPMSGRRSTRCSIRTSRSSTPRSWPPKPGAGASAPAASIWSAVTASRARSRCGSACPTAMRRKSSAAISRKARK